MVSPLRRTGRTRLTFAMLVLTSITLITLDLRDFEPIQGARTAALEAMAPVKDGAAEVLEPVGDMWNGAMEYDELEAENEELRERIDELQGELALSIESRQTLEELYQALDIPYLGDIESVVARVVAGPVSNFDNTLEIDRGSNDGLRVGMPVVNGAGLVGRLSDVSATRSLIILVTDPTMRIGVRLAVDREIGVAQGLGAGRELSVFSGIESDVDVAEGEVVVTSGIDRALFPGGIPIGTVVRTVEAPGGFDQEVFVEPLPDLDALTFVDVLLWEPEP